MHTVLVTGGCGFLGQHVVKHLQLYGENIKEIRILDFVPFERKLEYNCDNTITSIIGDIQDVELVTRACKGVDAVFHLASKIDVSLLPDVKSMYDVNVKGTQNIIKACKEHDVQYLIYCGTLGSFYGYDAVRNGTETSVTFPKKCAHGHYGETKRKALEIVINENGSSLRNGKVLRTIGILPPGMYGELDPTNTISRNRSVRNGIYYRVMGAMEAKLQYSYVGNVAMMFVRAYQSLLNNEKLGGQYYFAVDDSPQQTHIEHRKPYIGETIGTSSWFVSHRFVCAVLHFIYFCLLIISPFKKINFQLSPNVINFVNTTFYVTYEKAKMMFGYKPLYDYKESIRRTIDSLPKVK
ncbi:3 beta-hydroxysteroid dehydrogenase type 7-like isoform X1 [Mytilus edulis]|uniref:3 beta-hydroxysteroid dehydrogenase type 7-like isoform X1 n=1 Tax=Mytilus edulis TaxID=6550 RepID=UPI0039EF70EB